MVALNRNSGTLDTQLELRDITDGAETSTAAETGLAFNPRKIGDYKVVINISARDYTTEDETYALTVGISDAVGGTYTTVATLASATIITNGAGRYELPLMGNWAELLDDDAAFINITATLGGTSPSITYGAHLEPAV